jgi:CHAT domain-containing protein
LAEKYTFTYLESGRALTRFVDPNPARQGAIIYANPAFGDDSHRFSARRGVDREAVRGMDFEALPATETEALQIAALLDDATALTGRSATKTSLRGLRGPRVLHIATHGVFLRDPPLEGDNLNALFDFVIQPIVGDDAMYRSGLVFSDGVLSAEEVANLDLSGTQLVTLSACETGLGEIHNGEGVIGLRRAFVLAGARSVLMSLWKVDDEETLKLMLSFYQAVLRGESKSEALRAAQLDSIRQGREPYYWAAWILSGDGGPLTLERKQTIR